jgi:archaemetzincin
MSRRTRLARRPSQRPQGTDAAIVGFMGTHQPPSRREALAALGAAGASLVAPRICAGQSYGTMAIRPQDARVAVQPLGPFDTALYDQIATSLAGELSVNVQRESSIDLPRSAYYARNRRYRAERLLDFLRRRVASPVNRILGVTEVDISTSAHGVYDWGVLGLGDLPGPACVISMFRCRRNARNAAQVHFRMVTTCVHEVGHTLGLDHCRDVRCLMTDARGTVRTIDQSSGRLCNRCRTRLGLAPRPA